MADLLECLIQIKGLAETPRRVETLLREAAKDRWRARPASGGWAPIEILGHLADMELIFGVRLRLMLLADRPLLPHLDSDRLAARSRYLQWAPAVAAARFTERRRENLELLDTCSADELNRVGIHPDGHAGTVADLIAALLAHDTSHIGQLVQRLRDHA